MDCRQELQELFTVLSIFLQCMLKREMFGFPLFIEPGGVGCQKGKGILLILVFYEMEKDPAHEVHIGTVLIKSSTVPLYVLIAPAKVFPSLNHTSLSNSRVR